VPEEAIRIEGVVTEAMADGTCWVRLANGHRVRGYRTRRDREDGRKLAAGQPVLLEMSPFDFSKGRIRV
jgi:translation initiation factor IF-1